MNELEKIVEALGEEELLCQCADECTELAQALLQMCGALEGTTDVTWEHAQEQLTKELAGVAVYMTVLFHTYLADSVAVARLRDFEINRWISRFKKESNND